MNKNDLAVVILAAGKSSRMKSKLSKVFHPLGGRPVLDYVLQTASMLNPLQTIIVVAPGTTLQAKDSSQVIVVQSNAHGTGDAVKCAMDVLSPAAKRVLVIFGDTPFVSLETLQRILHVSDKTLSLLAMRVDQPNAYGRLITTDASRVLDVVEFRECSDDQKKITLCNSGVLAGDADLLKVCLGNLKPSNKAGEYYLTDCIKEATALSNDCFYVAGDEEEFLGINDRKDLAKAEAFLQDKWRHEALMGGVTMFDPSSVYFSYDTIIATDVTIHPHVSLGVGVVIEEDVTIFPFSRLEKTTLCKGSSVGPFAHLRDNTRLEEGAQIGNFVEVKKSTFAPGAKAKHLSYIGDATVGAKANIGAGTITCNYDGAKKHQTIIGEGAFIGSNTSLLAPVTIGNFAIVAAGSTISGVIEDDALAITRPEQRIITKGAQRYRARQKKG